MQRQRQSEAFKKAAVQKFHSRGNRKVNEIADELGVSSWSLYQWGKRYAISSGMKTKNQDRRPQDWSAEEKFKAVMEFDGLKESEQGEFLRSEGLHSEHLAAWKKSMQASLEPSPKPSAEARAERAEDKRKILELERELRRKEKALAEAAALLILKKKADLIWGTGENE